jgi:hypothetical protein
MSPAPRKPSVIGSLPNTRPHRRSARRPAVDPPAVSAEGATVSGEASPAAAAAKAKPKPKPPARAEAKPKPAARAGAKAKPATARAKPTARKAPTAAGAGRVTEPPPAAENRPDSPGALGTAVQAAAELAEIGLQVGARTLRRTLDRLPRP